MVWEVAPWASCWELGPGSSQGRAEESPFSFPTEPVEDIGGCLDLEEVKLQGMQIISWGPEGEVGELAPSSTLLYKQPSLLLTLRGVSGPHLPGRRAACRLL